MSYEGIEDDFSVNPNIIRPQDTARLYGDTVSAPAETADPETFRPSFDDPNDIARFAAAAKDLGSKGVGVSVEMGWEAK
jgi:hypothetical protein